MIFKKHLGHSNWKFRTRVSDLFKLLTFRLYLTMTIFLLVLGVLNPFGLFKPRPVPVQLTSGSPLEPQTNPIPILAYYYIWFDVKSWDRAKTDLPLLGRYSSDDADVIRQHIKWAKAAGIKGFIVSWKGTDKLNSRLEKLVQIAGEENFKLAVIYEGLDFYRNPLPIAQVEADLDYFIGHYGKNPVFDIFEKPMFIWSGTWKYSSDEVKSVVDGRKDQVFVLATEKNVKGYQRLQEIVDGDAYYWSSVNPESHPGYAEKLSEMSQAIPKNGGLWIAPAAPGYDARLVGGSSFVERKEGETLRTEMSAAFQSAPDAVAVISWNEFSENSHIEPSQNYGNRSLEVLTEGNYSRVSPISDFDSSIPLDVSDQQGMGRILALTFMGALIFLSLFVIVGRSYRANRNDRLSQKLFTGESSKRI